MYSKKFGRFILGFCTRCLTSVVNGTSTWTAVSWTSSVCKHHTQFLERRSQIGFAVVRIRSASKTTVDPNEVKRFQLLADKWWNEQGDFAVLHSMNDLRVPFIRDNLLNVHGGRQPGTPLAGLRILDVGCGGGLLTEPGGSLFITTINKTKLSYALAIVAAEALRIVPSGSHDWDKFVSPVELERLLESNGFHVESIRGMLYNPLSRAWSWTESTSINYALHAVKLEEEPDPDEDDPDDPTVIVAQAKARRWYN